MSVPPPSWVPNSTSTGSLQLAGQVRPPRCRRPPARCAATGSRPAPRQNTPRVHRRRTPSSRTGRGRARRRGATAWCCLAVRRPAARARSCGAPAGSVRRLARIVAVPVDVGGAAGGAVRAARFSAPGHRRAGSAGLTAAPGRPTTVATTARADCLAVARASPGSARAGVPTRCTSGSTASQHLRFEQQPGQAQPLDRVLLHDLDHCWTGKHVRMSPSQRATRGRRAEPGRAAAA